MFMRLLSSGRIQEDISRSVCILCNEAMEDRTAHVLFQCSRTSNQFENELQLLQQAMPPAMWMQFEGFRSHRENCLYRKWDEQHVFGCRGSTYIYTSGITSNVCIHSYFKHH